MYKKNGRLNNCEKGTTMKTYCSQRPRPRWTEARTCGVTFKHEIDLIVQKKIY